jgi:hypothetical protein
MSCDMALVAAVARRESFAAYVSAELMNALPEQVASMRCAHNQSYDLLEREAGVPRTLVEFDPRRVLLQKSPPSMVALPFNTPELSPG